MAASLQLLQGFQAAGMLAAGLRSFASEKCMRMSCTFSSGLWTWNCL